VAALAGTPYLPSFTGSLLFLEDIDEEPYRVDRMMVQLRLAGILKKTGGILMGQFTDCGPKDPSKPSLTLDQVIGENAATVMKPFMTGVPFGHEARKMTIPVGVKARMDTESGTIDFVESAVR
jgi:muramoyltetrapeptide carboxypeptidase